MESLILFMMLSRNGCQIKKFKISLTAYLLRTQSLLWDGFEMYHSAALKSTDTWKLNWIWYGGSVLELLVFSVENRDSALYFAWNKV